MIFRELEEENNALQAEYERLRGSKSNSCATLPAKTGEVDMVTEAKMLRQHKGRLEARMQILEEHNRQLEAQLQRLRQLLDEVNLARYIMQTKASEICRRWMQLNR